MVKSTPWHTLAACVSAKTQPHSDLCGPSLLHPERCRLPLLQATEIPRYHTWFKFDYQYDRSAYRSTGEWNAQCMDQAYYGSTWSAILKVGVHFGGLVGGFRLRCSLRYR